MDAAHPIALRRKAVLDGVRAIAPLIVPGLPFGLVLGVLIADSNLVDNLAGWSSSWIIFAGSAQFAGVLVLQAGGGLLLTVLTIIVVNARHVMYSAALAGRYAAAPRWFKIVGPYVLVDQAFAVADQLPPDTDLEYRMWHHLGAGFTAWVLWQTWVAIGILVGASIPEEWSLDFAVPLLFLGLLVLVLRNRPAIIAGLVGGFVAVASNGFPSRLGLLIGGLAGMAAGGIAEWFEDKRASS